MLGTGVPTPAPAPASSRRSPCRRVSRLDRPNRSPMGSSTPPSSAGASSSWSLPWGWRASWPTGCAPLSCRHSPPCCWRRSSPRRPAGCGPVAGRPSWPPGLCSSAPRAWPRSSPWPWSPRSPATWARSGHNFRRRSTTSSDGSPRGRCASPPSNWTDTWVRSARGSGPTPLVSPHGC